MTDSIKTSISLTKLAEMSRMDIQAKICAVSNPWGECQDRYTKPSRQKSPMADTETKWVARCAPGTGELAGYSVPSQIDGDLNIPNAITGHNVEHGTSVFAAGVAALGLQRIWLAKCGLPRDQLDLLTVADVTLRGVTITYLISCTTHEEAVALADAINVTGKVLNPKCKSWDSTNITVIIPDRDFKVIAYIKTDLSHCKWKESAPVDSMVDRTSYIVRIEAKLGLPFLRDRNLVTLESWRDAYARGEYEKIFNETVRKSLRLVEKRLRHKAPREEVYALMTETEERLLRGYIAGRDPRKFKSIVESANPAKRYSELRLRILDIAKIDIGIPWKDHVKLRCFELEQQLRYPGDYHPTEEHASWCFCEANWPSLLEQMRLAYEAALSAAVFRNEDSDDCSAVAA